MISAPTIFLLQSLLGRGITFVRPRSVEANVIPPFFVPFLPLRNFFSMTWAQGFARMELSPQAIGRSKSAHGARRAAQGVCQALGGRLHCAGSSPALLKGRPVVWKRSEEHTKSAREQERKPSGHPARQGAAVPGRAARNAPCRARSPLRSQIAARASAPAAASAQGTRPPRGTRGSPGRSGSKQGGVEHEDHRQREPARAAVQERAL